MRHLAWFLNLKLAKGAEIMYEAALLSADKGINEKMTPEEKAYQSR
jgi:hypothetical protein